MKPYAWVSLPENEIQILPFPDDGKTLVAGDGFYLYTRPAELTDEEILKVAANKFLTSEHRLVLLFARDLLRKAQEK